MPYLALLDFDWTCLSSLLRILTPILEKSGCEYRTGYAVLHLEELHDHRRLWGLWARFGGFHVQLEIPRPALYDGHWGAHYNDLLLRVYRCPHRGAESWLRLRYFILA